MTCQTATVISEHAVDIQNWNCLHQNSTETELHLHMPLDKYEKMWVSCFCRWSKAKFRQLKNALHNAKLQGWPDEVASVAVDLGVSIDNIITGG